MWEGVALIDDGLLLTLTFWPVEVHWTTHDANEGLAVGGSVSKSKWVTQHSWEKLTRH